MASRKRTPSSPPSRGEPDPSLVPATDPAFRDGDPAFATEPPATEYLPIEREPLTDRVDVADAGPLTQRAREEPSASWAQQDEASVVDSAITVLDDPSASTGVAREHLRGLLEALLFMSAEPKTTNELCAAASAERSVVVALLAEIRELHRTRGFRLDEVAGGWLFRTNPAYAPFLRDLTAQKPVKLTRAQIETLAIVAYRQPITRPEIDDVRGVDSGAVLKMLLERDFIRIVGKRDEAGRPLLYGTTHEFLAFFGLRSLRELPSLHELSELNDDSRRVFAREMGEAAPPSQAHDEGLAGGEGAVRTTVAAPAPATDAPEEMVEGRIADDVTIASTPDASHEPVSERVSPPPDTASITDGPPAGEPEPDAEDGGNPDARHDGDAEASDAGAADERVRPQGTPED